MPAGICRNADHRMHHSHGDYQATRMFRLGPVPTVIPLLVMPVIAWYGLKMENGLGQVYDKISEQTVAELNTVAQENLAACDREGVCRDKRLDRFKRYNKRYYD